MCTEFILILIYFLILSLVNYLLFQLLQYYWKKNSSLQKYQNIFNQYKTQNLEIISFCYFFSKDNQKNKNQLDNIIFSSFPIQDFFLLGNFYSILSKKNKGLRKNSYYFELLKFQYLPLSFRKNEEKNG